MSTIRKYETVCALCGKTSEQAAVTSASEFESRDLDGRPATMLRETMRYWIEECPHCGYVNHKISDKCGLSLAELQKQYVIFNSEHVSVLSKKFAKCGWLMGKSGDPLTAMRNFLRAAWACDDEGDTTWASFSYRETAIKFAEQCLVDRSQLHNWGELHCMVMDMQRRIGEFGIVVQLSEPRPRVLRLMNDTLLRLMSFQKELAVKKDSEAHKMEEIPDYAGGTGGMYFTV